MHPTIRILLLLSLASILPLLSLSALALGGLLVLAVYLRFARAGLARLRAGIWRLRWLLLAIFVLYGGFTPGEPLLQALPGLSREGVLEGLRRALVLIDLLVAVYLLLTLTPVPELVIGLRVLLTPLRAFGVDPQRIGLRIALAFDGVAALQARLKAPAQQGDGIWNRAAALISEIEAQADQSDGASISVPALAAPRWWEWLLPVVPVLAGLAWLS